MGGAPPAKLYRRVAGGLEFWESWNDEGRTTVHSGRVGERGEVRRLVGDETTRFLAAKVPELYAAGFRPIPEEEHVFLLVAVPAEAVPRETEAAEALWERLELLVDEALGWTGLGHCTGVDVSGAMVAMAEVVDAHLSVRVLAEAIAADPRLPPGVAIAVREDGEDVVRWPPARAGDELP